MMGVNETRGHAETPSSRALKKAPDRLFNRMPAGIDLQDEVQAEGILSTADELLGRVNTLRDLAEIECLMSSQREEWPLGAHLAVKLARSKGFLRSRSAPMHLSVVVPVYGEHERVLRPGEHRLGEGFLDRKLRELDWLLPDEVPHEFELLVVDDGCPDGSGQLCEEVLSSRHRGAPARVLYLADAIEQELPVTASLRSLDESRKGGSIQLGLWEATRKPREGHVVLYTDADLSTHLGQSGLLVHALDSSGVAIAAGSRRSRDSITVKSSARSARGRLFIYLWKKLLPELGYLEDTQCGFKAMSADVARHLADAPIERGFAFDLEMLLRCELSSPRATASVPIAWIDSQDASTTTALSPYLTMLRSVVGLYRMYSSKRLVSEAFSQAIELLDEPTWQQAIDTLGPRLEGIHPSLDRDYMPLLPSELAMGRA